jgi:hypothetical protein
MKIEEGKPTNKIHGVGRKLKYDFNKLEVNQCIVLDETDNETSITNSAYAYAKRHKMKFKREKDEQGVIRIYRTK